MNVLINIFLNTTSSIVKIAFMELVPKKQIKS